MQNSKRGLLAFRHEVTLSKEQCLKIPQEVEEMRHIPYATAVGSFMYVMLCTRPDICYADTQTLIFKLIEILGNLIQVQCSLLMEELSFGEVLSKDALLTPPWRDSALRGRDHHTDSFGAQHCWSIYKALHG
ncbi:gag/pol protein [Cucumis melo var. makuwa]|uniref:Gag/pol protein n=1 Tax=Cucumis melo var. makuwa TaxID=1194695 RepID=A0A5A7VDW7_CUCMM|nr:gag/pol protein [Cucumis melo var. makuwa]